MVLLPPNIIPSPTSPLTSLRLKKEKNRVWKLGNGLLTALFPHPSLQWALGILEGHGDIFEGSWQGAWKAEEAIRTVGDRHVKHPASQEMSWLLKGFRSMECWWLGGESLGCPLLGRLNEAKQMKCLHHLWSNRLISKAATADQNYSEVWRTFVPPTGRQ